MKQKVLSVLLSVSLFFVSLSVCPGAVTSYAVGAAVVEFIDTAVDVLDFLQCLSDTLEKYFGYDVTTFKGMSKYEVRSRLVAEFKHYAADITSGFTRDQLYTFVTSWSIQDFDTITSEFGAEVSAYCNTNVSDFYDHYKMVMYYFDSPADFVDALYSSSLNDYNVDDKGNVSVPVEDFKEEIIKQNTTIAPKNRDMLKYSWRDLSNNQENVDSNSFARLIYDEGISCVGTSFEDGLYVQIYMLREGYMYYHPYQFKFYRTKESLGGDSPVYKYEWHVQPIYYKTLNGVSLDTFDFIALTLEDSVNNSGEIVSRDYPYLSLGLGYDNFARMFLSGFNSREDCFLNKASARNLYALDGMTFMNGSSPEWGTIFSSQYKSLQYSLLREDDISITMPLDYTAAYHTDGLRHFFAYSNCNYPETIYPISYHDQGKEVHYGYKFLPCDEGCTCDFGFLVSSEQFSTVYQFDTTRLSTNSTVTISGDSVYDYSITDNSTGDTSTIYNYVTNNYTYPENSGGSTSGGNGGGTVGGSITIGGQVDVGGKVDVNVNVNGGGYGVSADMPDMTPIDDYLTDALEESFGIRQFFKTFFDFLPPEILVLLGIGLTVVILARIFGR